MHRSSLKIARALEQLEDLQHRLENFVRGVTSEYDPDEFQRLAWNLAMLYKEDGRLEDAFSSVEQLICCTYDSEALARYYMHLGKLKVLLNDFESAILYYLHAKSLQPKDKNTAYFIRNDVGYCLNNLGKHEEAEGYCRAAIMLDPALHNAHRNLGIALQGKGNYTAAAGSFIRAVDAGPFDSRAIQLLLKLTDERGEIEQDIPDIKKEVRRCFDLVCFEWTASGNLMTFLTH